MDNREFLTQVTIESPCNRDWNGIRGEDRVRFCNQCGKEVDNLSAMMSDDAWNLVHDRVELSIRRFRRPDGTVMTSEFQATAAPIPLGRWQLLPSHDHGRDRCDRGRTRSGPVPPKGDRGRAPHGTEAGE